MGIIKCAVGLIGKLRAAATRVAPEWKREIIRDRSQANTGVIFNDEIELCILNFARNELGKRRDVSSDRDANGNMRKQAVRSLLYLIEICRVISAILTVLPLSLRQFHLDANRF